MHEFMCAVSAKWSFGYGTASIADAVADSIKMKAKHIADKTEVLVREFNCAISINW